MKKIITLCLSLCLTAALAAPAYALEYSIDAPNDYDFGKDTSIEVIHTADGGAMKNTDVSKNAALIPPVFGSESMNALHTPALSTEDTGSADAAASKGSVPPVGEMTPTHSQPSGQAGQTAPAGAEYRAPTVGETVVRMLHHMSRIFEDNSKIDQIHRGLQIDRKRRQELQRKRLAMGHKPDDHEEQTFR